MDRGVPFLLLKRINHIIICKSISYKKLKPCRFLGKQRDFSLSLQPEI